ncbi:MAG: hypothetical protein Q9226_008689 [Calogaya cf. arnoldii]
MPGLEFDHADIGILMNRLFSGGGWKIISPEDLEDPTCYVCWEKTLKPTSSIFPREVPVRLSCHRNHVFGMECLIRTTMDKIDETRCGRCPMCRTPFIHYAGGVEQPEDNEIRALAPTRRQPSRASSEDSYNPPELVLRRATPDVADDTQDYNNVEASQHPHPEGTANEPLAPGSTLAALDGLFLPTSHTQPRFPIETHNEDREPLFPRAENDGELFHFQREMEESPVNETSAPNPHDNANNDNDRDEMDVFSPPTPQSTGSPLEDSPTDETSAVPPQDDTNNDEDRFDMDVDFPPPTPQSTWSP